jgi:hypothetical protein
VKHSLIFDKSIPASDQALPAILSAVTFWHYIRTVVVSRIMKIFKHPKKIHFILATLLVLNVVAFFTVSAITQRSDKEVNIHSVEDNAEAYMDSGLDVLNWSYTLIRYFRHPG